MTCRVRLDWSGRKVSQLSISARFDDGVLVMTRHARNDESFGSNFLTDEDCVHMSDMMSVNSSRSEVFVISSFMLFYCTWMTILMSK